MAGLLSFLLGCAIVILAIAASASASASETSELFTFLGIGDWGAAYIGQVNPSQAELTQNVYKVAAQMANISSLTQAKFIVNTGDNFYWCGVQNASDAQIKADFEDPYSAPSLQLRWYGALGNHEYGYNVDAQIEYTKLSKTWYIPARYYSERIQLDATHFLSLIVLDTSPCVSGYRGDDWNFWDPCFPKYPTCSVMNTDDDFEGPCKFNENILSQSCDAQYEWLQETLKNVPADDWLVVVGHHPLDEPDVKDFASLVQKHGFSLYLNGHTHVLNQYTLNGKGAYVTTGAGSMVKTVDQEHPVTARKLSSHTVHSPHGQTYETVCSKKVAGFTAHTFNADFTQLTTLFYDNKGNVVNKFTSDRHGVWTAEPGAC